MYMKDAMFVEICKYFYELFFWYQFCSQRGKKNFWICMATCANRKVSALLGSNLFFSFFFFL